MVKAEKIHFQVSDLFCQTKIAGRNCGSPFSVGTVFSRLTRRTYSEKSDGESRFDELLESGLEIKVVGVECYGLEEVPTAYVAALTLEGSDTSVLVSYFENAGNGQYLGLEA